MNQSPFSLWTSAHGRQRCPLHPLVAGVVMGVFLVIVPLVWMVT